MDGQTTHIARELEAATAAKKCHACGCFHDTVEALGRSDLARSLDEVLGKARSVFTDRESDCLGCKICWPAKGFNLAAEVVSLPSGAGCRADPPTARTGWPQLPGDYRVSRYSAPVAVCTLHSRGLEDAVSDEVHAGVSILGPLQTENLGIERVVANVVGNPHIRFLLLCGEDSGQAVGHYPGQSLLSLSENGVDEKGRIQGARGQRPVIENIDLEIVDHFRDQVEVLDHRGLCNVAEIVERIDDAASRDPGPATGGPTVSLGVRILRAEPPPRSVLDPAGFVVITPDRRRGRLLAEHYRYPGVLTTVVEGDAAADVMATLLQEGLVTRLDHAAYLGRELTRAEAALRDEAPYVQDRAPASDDENDPDFGGEADCGPSCPGECR